MHRWIFVNRFGPSTIAQRNNAAVRTEQLLLLRIRARMWPARSQHRFARAASIAPTDATDLRTTATAIHARTRLQSSRTAVSPHHTGAVTRTGDGYSGALSARLRNGTGDTPHRYIGRDDCTTATTGATWGARAKFPTLR